MQNITNAILLPKNLKYMRKILFSIILFFCIANTFGQNNTGTPYSQYGIGLLQDNYGPYTAMGGVAAAMRDNNNINFLNPASYTALDSNRFYFQLGINGEYVDIATNKDHGNYRVAQNAALTMGLRLFKNTYASFGFNERSDIGYDLLYTQMISGDELYKYNLHIQGEGGLNDVYFGAAHKLRNFSIGFNAAYVFGKIEKQQTLSAQLSDSYYIRTSDKIRVNSLLFDVGLQYQFNLSQKSKLTLGSTVNFNTKLNAKKTYQSYKVNNTTGSSNTLIDEVVRRGTINYPFRIVSGFNYDYKDKWNLAGDYAYQNMSDYHEFGENQKYNDYHRASMGVSMLPARYGRFWWQRNKYMLGTYMTRSHVELNNVKVNTYGLTIGTQMPFYIPNRELLLGVAFDLGIRGTKQNGLIQEKYAKIRINIAFKEGWFMKRKID